MAVLRLAEPIDFFIASLTQRQDLWTVFSNGTNKQGLYVYLEWGEGRRMGEKGREKTKRTWSRVNGGKWETKG